MKYKRLYTPIAVCAALACTTSITLAADTQPTRTITDNGVVNNYWDITINNITEDTGIELGTNSRARGTGSIATGQNSLAIGKNATATGGNETKETITQKLEENRQKLADIETAQNAVNDTLKSIQDLRTQEAKTIEAGERVKAVKLAKENARVDWQTKLDTYNQTVADSAAFLKEAQDKIDDLNSRLTGMSRLGSIDISSDDGLNSAASQLKTIVEDGTTLDLGTDFYKNYVKNYYQSLGDLRQNEIIKTKFNLSNGNIFSSNFPGTNTRVINPYNGLYISVNGGLDIDSKSVLYTTSNGILSADAFNNNLINGLTKPDSDFSFVNHLTEIVSKNDYDKAIHLGEQFKQAWRDYFNNSNDQMLTDDVKEASFAKTDYAIDARVKSYEIAYYQGQYESTHDTTWLDKKNTAINEYSVLISNYSQSINPTMLRKKNMSNWISENITNIKEMNKITTDKLTSDLETALGINKDAIKAKESEIANLKKIADQAKINYDNINPNPQDVLYAAQYEKVMTELTKKAQDLQDSQARLEALKAALTLNDLTNVGENAMAVGTDSLATGNNSIAIGTSALSTGENAISIGNGSSVTGRNSIAIGTGHIVIGNNAGAFGDPNTVYGDGSYAFGNDNTIGSATTPNTVGTNTFVLGSNVNTTANNAVILGNNSTATEDNVVSIGRSGGERKLINLAKGTLSDTSTDAINGSQLFNPSNNDNKDQLKTNWQSLLGDGVVTQGNTGLVTGDTVNTAIQNAVANVSNSTSTKVQSGAHTNVTNAVENGVTTYTVNIIDTGTVTNGNTELVTGGTVYTAIQDAVANFDATNKANTDLDNITDSGKDVIKTIAGETVTIGNGSYTTVTDTGTDGKHNYSVSVTVDGKVESGNTGIVTGDTVFKAVDGKANANLDNITDAGQTVIKNLAKGSINIKNGTNITVNKTVVDGTDTYTINAIGDGKIESGNTGLVTGDTVYKEINTIKGDVTNKANTDLDNITDSGKDVIKTIAGETVTIGNGSYTTVTDTGTDGKHNYSVSVTVDGKVESGNTGIVTGDTVFKAVDGKANANLDNITTEGQSVIKNLAKDVVKVVNGTNTTVTSTTVGDTTQYAVNVDNQSIINAVQPSLDAKANKDASNLSTSDVEKWRTILNVSNTDSLVKTDGTTVTIDPNGTANTIDISHTVNGETTGRTLTGIVTDTSDATSAVNMNTLVNYGNSIASDFDGKLRGLDNRLSSDIKHAGATAAALAGLHPLSYDPSNKGNFAIAQGRYRGANATALGFFYQPNEDIMLNLAGTVSNGDKAMNAGVSFRFGSGNEKKKLVKQADLDALQAENKAMKEQINKLATIIYQTLPANNGHKLDVSKQASFPDVPQNHWAKEAVDTLNGNDVLEGYPDGNFHGDRQMTRYEYAQMMYKATK